MNKIQKKAVSAIRVLSSEAIDKANSGHPGLPLGCATIGFTLFSKFLNLTGRIPIITTATDLFCPQVMDPCFCIRCYISSAAE